jgi:hypothetical protein
MQHHWCILPEGMAAAAACVQIQGGEHHQLLCCAVLFCDFERIAPNAGDAAGGARCG